MKTEIIFLVAVACRDKRASFPGREFQNSRYFWSLSLGREVSSAGCRAHLQAGSRFVGFQQQLPGDLAAAEQHQAADASRGGG